MVEAKTIIDAIIMLEENSVDKAIVPIENSIQGSVSDTIDTLVKYDDIFVSQELVLDINQNIMSAKNMQVENIERIYSHSQAISQCREYLKNHGLYEKVIPVESTARAAQIVQESNENIACIGSSACADEYNLSFIEKNIQDNDSNKTRFWVLSKEDTTILRGSNTDRTNNSNSANNINDTINTNSTKKMSMVFSVQNKPGTLYEALQIFYKYGLNLTKIESRPAKTRLGEYIFIIDVETDGTKHLQAIDDIKSDDIYYRILGIY